VLFTQEQTDFNRKVRKFVLEELEPVASEIDRKGEFPWDIIRKLGTMGLMGVNYPKEMGGLGLDTVCYAIAVEQISRACGSTGITVAAHNSLAIAPIYLFGTEAQKRKYIPPLARGEKMGAFGLTEPEAGSDAGATKTRAVLDGDSWVINGSKCFITNASVAETYVITARSSDAPGTRGISSFILEKGMKGLNVGKKENKMGLRGSDTAELYFEDLRIPRENLLGKEGEGFKEFMITLDGGRISIGAMALGIAQGALDKAIEWAKERVQFGQRICQFQAIQWKLADMATQLEAARQLVYRAARLKDGGQKYTKESAMAKLYASEVGSMVTHQAMQIWGGRGYSEDYPLERYYRDVRLCEIGEGTSEIQRLVIARQCLR
jgi:alkylation response protein AidB-like acyl-CoA dehydrogenase